MLLSVSLLPVLLPALLAPTSPAAPPGRDLLAAVPRSAVLAVHIADPKALIAARQTNDWIAFAMDPEWKAITSLLFAGFDEEDFAVEFEMWRQGLFGALANSTDLVLFMDPGFDHNEPTFGIIAHGGDDTAAFLRSLVPSDDPASVDGEPVTTTATHEWSKYFHRASGLSMVVFGANAESVDRVGAACLAGIDGPAPQGPFAVPAIAAERRLADLELAVDLSLLWSELERDAPPADGIERQLADALTSVDWMYGSVSFGKDEVSDWELIIPYGRETLLGGLVGFFGEADLGLLETIPAGATSGMVAAFDVSGFADWTLELIRNSSPESRDMLDAGLGAITEAVGIDIMNDVIHNLSGQFLTFASPNTASTEGRAFPGMQAATFVIMVDDASPFIDMVDSLLEMGGFGSSVESDTAAIDGDDDGLELWRLDPELGTELTIAVGAGRLVLSIDREGFDRYIELASKEEDETSFLTDPGMAAAAASLSGAVVSIQSTAAFADSFQASVRGVESMLAGLPSSDGSAAPLAKAVEAVDRLTVLVRQYFEGTTAVELRIADGRIRYVARTR